MANQDDSVTVPSLDFQRLRVISVLGRGAKGVVFLVKGEEPAEELMALKVISKDLIERRSKDTNSDGSEYRRVSFEQQVLRRFDHPLLPKLLGVLDTEKLAGYAIDYCPGRDLNCLRKRQTERMFSDEVIRFYAAELVLVLDYLHGLGVVYRDLKPENIMIQESGHIMLVDFDLSTELSPIRTPPRSAQSDRIRSNSIAKSIPVQKKRRSPFHRFCNSGISPDETVAPPELRVNSESLSGSDLSEKSNSFVGTEEYVAPEIVSGHGHDFGVDWWSLGVLLYEMLYGTTPFRGSNRKETFYRILTKTPELTGQTTALRDLIKNLLEKDPKQRIGSVEIKGHDFFKGVEWDSVLRMSRPPYIPETAPAVVTDGIENKIDVETVVKGVFGGEDGGGEEEENKGKESEENNRKWNNNGKEGNEEDVNKRVCVEGCDAFLVF
ncbi:serine/threonine-protein kinase OXI1-like [Pyrus ussuriensis x Pyrus communis]|uniref:non-specific serine/threonine protein kinase n=1 Tax=Pyrus ussuriensis x Pyrus communis TaxID=2448454 RepID=A0A5N5FGF5_9ROSA|nr:serine/threonine-protein kinase OXI1-like [Pyrus ussuriensis x Pyrus communis]